MFDHKECFRTNPLSEKIENPTFDEYTLNRMKNEADNFCNLLQKRYPSSYGKFEVNQKFMLFEGSYYDIHFVITSPYSEDLLFYRWLDFIEKTFPKTWDDSTIYSISDPEEYVDK